MHRKTAEDPITLASIECGPRPSLALVKWHPMHTTGGCQVQNATGAITVKHVDSLGGLQAPALRD